MLNVIITDITGTVESSPRDGMIPLHSTRHAGVQKKNRKLVREAGANRLIIRRPSERLVKPHRTRQ